MFNPCCFGGFFPLWHSQSSTLPKEDICTGQLHNSQFRWRKDGQKVQACCCISSVHEILTKAKSIIKDPAVITLLIAVQFSSTFVLYTEKDPFFSLQITTLQWNSHWRKSYHDSSVWPLDHTINQLQQEPNKLKVYNFWFLIVLAASMRNFKRPLFLDIHHMRKS